jgi:hypothetical protein
LSVPKVFPRCSSNPQCEVPQDFPNSISFMRSGTDFIPLDFSLLGFGWREGGDFWFFWGVCSQDVLQIPNVFLKMFPRASHFLSRSVLAMLRLGKGGARGKRKHDKACL